ncbi:tyrosine-type recombinase/integrase [Kiloniella sp.]|uniref:tyrosine-type recombinase/integrase n=1 Tax=Kiloniella sp. TaxID=1938587 RepID=UPI003A8F1F8D
MIGETSKIISFEDWRSQLQATNNYLPDEIQDLWDFPITPISKLGDEQIIIPEHWMPAGSTQSLNLRSITINNAVPVGLNLDNFHERLNSLRKAILCLFLYPRYTKTGVRQLKPASLLMYSKELLKMARDAMQSYPNPEGKVVFSHLDEGQVAEIIELATNNHAALDRQVIFSAITQYRERGYLEDAPSWKDDVLKVSERQRKDQPAQKNTQNKDNKWAPFPDKFVSEIGWRSLWLVEEMGPTLLDFWEKHHKDQRDKSSKFPTVIEERRELIQSHNWTDKRGKTLESLPFEIALKSGKTTKLVQSWPPENWGHVSGMIVALQLAHLTLVFASTGARWSEVAAATLGSVEELPDGGGRWYGTTWKLADDHTGEDREWPLPPEAVRAIKQQERLAKIMHHSPDNRHLWVTMKASRDRPAGSPLHRFNEPYNGFVRHLGLDHQLDNKNAHSHRWRKTLARLAAMALLGAPKILMDLFGHKQIEMTLRYILTNADVVAEIEEASRAYLYATNKEYINAEDLGELTGEGAERVQAVSEWLKTRHANDDFGFDDIDEATEILTVTGQEFRIVRQGVLCTKTKDETAPCTQDTNSINASNCSKCKFKACTFGAQNDADEVITSLVNKLNSLDSENIMIEEAYKGQILAHLQSFEALREKWIPHPLVAEIWAEGEAI